MDTAVVHCREGRGPPPADCAAVPGEDLTLHRMDPRKAGYAETEAVVSRLGSRDARIAKSLQPDLTRRIGESRRCCDHRIDFEKRGEVSFGHSYAKLPEAGLSAMSGDLGVGVQEGCKSLIAVPLAVNDARREVGRANAGGDQFQETGNPARQSFCLAEQAQQGGTFDFSGRSVHFKNRIASRKDCLAIARGFAPAFSRCRVAKRPFRSS